MKITRRQFINRMLLYGGIGLVGCHPILLGKHLLQINHYNIPVSNLPSNFHGFKIVHLTDIHYGPLLDLDFVKEIVKRANSIGGDIIVCTGDNVHERKSTKQIDTVWPILSQLKATHGVYSVLGNHDHWADFDKSKYWAQKSGQYLRHKSKKISKNGDEIWLGGAGDYFEDSIGIDEAFNDVPAKKCKIVLAHNPDTADQYFTTNIDLFISGHTHGGQVSIPFVGAPILPVRNKMYSSGYVQTSRTGVFISRGIGWAILPIRFNCYPEIAVLNLIPRERDNYTQQDTARAELNPVPRDSPQRDEIG